VSTGKRHGREKREKMGVNLAANGRGCTWREGSKKKSELRKHSLLGKSNQENREERIDQGRREKKFTHSSMAEQSTRQRRDHLRTGARNKAGVSKKTKKLKGFNGPRCRVRAVEKGVPNGPLAPVFDTGGGWGKKRLLEERR